MRAKVWLAVAAVFLAGVPNSLSAQSDELSALNKQFERYFEAGNWSSADGVFARAGPAYPGRVTTLNSLARLPDQPDVATALDSLARLYRAKGYYSDAELLLRRSLAIREKVLGPYHPDVATTLNNLAELSDPGAPTPSSRCFGVRSRSANGRLVPITPTWLLRSTTWPRCTEPRATTLPPSRCIGVRLRSARRRSIPAILTSLMCSTTWPYSITLRAATPRPSRYFGAR